MFAGYKPARPTPWDMCGQTGSKLLCGSIHLGLEGAGERRSQPTGTFIERRLITGSSRAVSLNERAPAARVERFGDVGKTRSFLRAAQRKAQAGGQSVPLGRASLGARDWLDGTGLRTRTREHGHAFP